MKSSDAFAIVEFENPATGTTSFRVTGRLKGKQIRINRASMAEALTVKQDYERQVLNLEPLPAITTRLTADQAAEAEAVFRRLTASGVKLSLTDAVDFAIKNWSNPDKKKLVADAVVEFLKSKKDTNSREAHLKTLSFRVGRLAEEFPKHHVNELQPAQIKPLIVREGTSPVTQDSDYRAMTNFFNWSKKQGYCLTSPMDKIERITLDEGGEPVILPLAKVVSLLNAALSYKEGALVPYVVLCVFCGIRPDREMARLTWDDINLTNKLIRIGPKIAKMRGRRIVEIPDNAVQFLIPHAAEKTPLKGPNWRKDFDNVKRLAGFGTVDARHIKFERTPKDQPKPLCYCEACCKARNIKLEEWPADVMRHTAISYHLAKHGNEGKTAQWAGNSPDIIHKSYKGLIGDPADVNKFYAIVPPKDHKIIHLKAA